ncbi:cell envelope biogenesis protein TolA [Sphingobium aquiterrae]|uniref:cell envelope biogenesis protein TolA n=1 Tax=Sphingobium aquiterrae TaxID=2038656 RepID=UPI003017CD20
MERSEKIGLGIATAGHVLLFGVLSSGFLSTPNPLKLNSPPMDVSMVDEVALQSMAQRVSTTPPPPSQAPEQGPTEEAAPAPAPEAAPEPEPEPVPAPPPPKPAPPRQIAEKAKPKPRPPAAPPKAVAKPAPPREKPAAKPAPAKETPKAKPKPAPEKPKASGSGTATRARGSLLGPDFLKGIQTEKPVRPTAPSPAPAAALGPQQKAALDQEIRRQLKAHWRPPSGADADQLVTLLSVHLDKNGRVVGSPELVDQLGVTASNRPQAKLHAERAIQAVMLASPFQNLPPEYYDQWKWLKPLRFDARLNR